MGVFSKLIKKPKEKKSKLSKCQEAFALIEDARLHKSQAEKVILGLIGEMWFVEYKDDIDAFLSKYEGGDVKVFIQDRDSTEGDIKNRLEALNVSLRTNVLSEKREFKKGNMEWKHLKVSDEKTLISDMESKLVRAHEKYGRFVHTKVKKEHWDIYGHALADRNKENPFLQWLDGFYNKVNHPHNMFESSMNLLFEFKDKELALFAIKSKMVEIIAKQYKPGIKYDQVPVLMGEKDIGKTTFWKNLFPLHSPLFRSDFRLIDKKIACEESLGAVLVDWSELQGLKKSDYTFVKDFISGDTDTVRHAYGREAVPKPRQFAIVGTSNPKDNLIPFDEKGERRFVIIKAKPASGQTIENNGYNIYKVLQNGKGNQILWNCAYTLYKENWSYSYPEKYKKSILEISKSFESVDDTLENVLELIINNPPDILTKEFASVGCKDGEVTEGGSLRFIKEQRLSSSTGDDYIKRYFRAFMKRKGYIRKRRNHRGSSLRYWVNAVKSQEKPIVFKEKELAIPKCPF